MPAVSYNNCMTTGHGSYGPTNIPATQSKLFVAGQAVLINGDAANYHGHSPVGICIATSTKLFVNGIPVVRIGDMLTDGDTVAQGSPKLFSN
ncbi:PAAR motif of membran proteins [Acinetobacter phage Acj9]|uniref:Uncharacterized protein 5.4 n=1 Tax=Acinetobacter phage Acj9 TaxID=760939 RepID=E5EPU6_9CAUD|nr:PAAR motif of membran proteins [Acinetobacter phage Acj9]ADG60062.1 conserved hypothetical protein [Acinetobacter phage Acj9]